MTNSKIFKAAHTEARKMRAFMLAIVNIDEYLYENSIEDIANDADVSSNIVNTWLKEYNSK